MEPIPTTPLITTNGEYKIFQGPPGAAVIVEIEGDLGAATVTIGRESITGLFRPYVENDAEVTAGAGELKVATLGYRGTLALKVTGGVGTLDIRFAVTRHRPQFYR